MCFPIKYSDTAKILVWLLNGLKQPKQNDLGDHKFWRKIQNILRYDYCFSNRPTRLSELSIYATNEESFKLIQPLD